MQLKKKQLVQKVGLAIFGATLALSASADTFTASVTTIDDVSITPVQDLDFGSTIKTTVGVCSMNALLPGGILMEYQDVDGGAEDSLYGATTNTAGAACIDALGSDTSVTPGVWRISGASGTGVNLLISQIAQASADYTFNPDGGCYVKFDNAKAAGDSDSCVTLIPGTVVPKTVAKLSNGDEAHTDDVEGIASIAGDLLFTVGGTITIVNALTAETDYPLTFQVDVTY